MSAMLKATFRCKTTKINPDFANECSHKDSMQIMWPKHKFHSEHGIVFLNRSVKILHLAAFLGMLIFTVLQGCKIEVLNGSSFYASSTQNRGLNALMI
jgi:hypothetical protein